jgi:hypothetical protein
MNIKQIFELKIKLFYFNKWICSTKWRFCSTIFDPIGSHVDKIVDSNLALCRDNFELKIIHEKFFFLIDLKIFKFSGPRIRYRTRSDPIRNRWGFRRNSVKFTGSRVGITPGSLVLESDSWVKLHTIVLIKWIVIKWEVIMIRPSDPLVISKPEFRSDSWTWVCMKIFQKICFFFSL